MGASGCSVSTGLDAFRLSLAVKPSLPIYEKEAPVHHGSLAHTDTVTYKLYSLLTAPERIGKWQDPLSLLMALREEYGVIVTAISTYMSSIRLQLRDNFPDWGEKFEGPRDAQPTNEEREILGKGNFYRVRKLVTVAEPTLWE